MTNAARWQGQVNHWQSVGRLPSLVAGVLHEGQLVWTGSAGATTGPDTAYRIGSITKTINAVAVMQARDAGLLSLDDPIGRFIPETGYRDATIRSLMAHVSGMQAEPVGPWWERSPGLSFDELCAANDGTGAVLAAGESFHYSNLGHALLGEAIARIRGFSWWDVVSLGVLLPLGMTETSYDEPAGAAQGYSVNHYAGTLTREPHQDTVAMAPAGQLWSTITDLAEWARFLTHGHERVLALSTLQEMVQPVAPATDYGLALRLLSHHGRSLVGHTGSMPGFMASLFADPKTGDGVIALTNATTGFDPAEFPTTMLDRRVVADPGDPWTPTESVPDWAVPLLGVWHWGNSAHAFRFHNGALESHSLAMGQLSDRFALQGNAIVGIAGYHLGETLHVVRRPDGGISHLDCATFIYTRQPYDPGAPIPGG